MATKKPKSIRITKSAAIAYHDTAWELYLRGVQGTEAIAQALKVDKRVATRLIHFGFAAYKLPALKRRYDEHKQAEQTEKQRVQEAYERGKQAAQAEAAAKAAEAREREQAPTPEAYRAKQRGLEGYEVYSPNDDDIPEEAPIPQRMPLTVDEHHQEVLQIIDQYEQTRETNLKILRAGKAGVAQLVKRWVTQAQSIKWEKTERYKTASGQWRTRAVPLPLNEYLDAGRKIAKIMADIMHQETVWYGAPTQHVAHSGTVNTEGTVPAWLALPPDVLEHIADTGQLPAGVNDEMLFGAVAAQLGPSKKRAANG